MTTNMLPVEDYNNLITPRNVKLALIYPFQHSNPLENLALVNQIVSDPAFPICIQGRTFILVSVLNAIIMDELLRHRQIMEIEPRPPETTFREALMAIVHDGQTSNTKLIGWSWLYYGYVRVDLGIGQQLFARTVCLEDRTVRRYQNAAIMHLTNIILDKEWETRRQHISMSMYKNHEGRMPLKG